MIIHILPNIAQEARRNNTHTAKSNACKIHILVTGSIRLLAHENNQVICSLVASDAWNLIQQWEQTCACELDRHADVCLVGDAELVDHGPADHLGGGGNELVDEDVVVDAITDGTANDTDGEG